MKKLLVLLGISLVICPMFTLNSCSKDEIETIEDEQVDPKEAEIQKILSANRFYMKKYYEDYFPYYFWYDDVYNKVSKFKYENYSTINEYFHATLFKDDRWSWMMTAQEYLEGETGEQTGTYGLSLGQEVEYYKDYDIKVRFIYPGSPLEEHGVTRGWTLTHLDSVPVMQYVALGKFEKALYKNNQLFTFKDTEGNSHTFRSSPSKSLFTRSSLRTQVFQPGDYPGLTEPVGYFLYMSFKAGFLSDIDSAFAVFKDAGVRKVILDLRYNGGGDGRASDLLVSYLAPDSADRKVYRKTIHNRLLTQFNSADTIHRQPNSLNLDDLYVICGEGSASASEVTVNGLSPYLNVHLVGDTTYGKPNGMYVLMYPGEDADYERYEAGDFSKLKLVYLPIAFFSKNSEDESIPYNGFIPDNYRPDDLRHDFGVTEDNIRACLEHIVSGSYPEIPRLYGAQRRSAISDKGLRIPDDLRTSPLYGRTLLPAPKELRK